MWLHKGDDVAVLLENAQPDDWIDAGGSKVVLKSAIPLFHKVALRSFAAGDIVRKVGEEIGVTTQPIAIGEHVHVHNIKSLRR
jgi:hypothetical protein